MAGHPPVNQLHVWWARRPLIASRAAIAASLLPTDADRDAFLANIGTTTEVVAARRQMDAIKAEGRWSDITFPNRRAFLHNPDFLTDIATPDPVILDVTAGGGSIPFEAGRLGLRAIANELNPVACFILRATCEWPQRYGWALRDAYQDASARFQTRVGELLADAGVYPDEPPPDCASGDCPHPQAVCGAPGCQHNTNRCSKIAHRAVRAHRYAQTYLWARTAECPNCPAVIPLSPNWRLDSKGTGIRVAPAPDIGTGIDAGTAADVDGSGIGSGIALTIVHDRALCPDCKAAGKHCHLAGLYPDGGISGGTVARAIATCPACGSTTPKGYLARAAQAGRMGHRLYCVIYRDSWRGRNRDGSASKRETTCRVFAAPQERHFASNARWPSW